MYSIFQVERFHLSLSLPMNRKSINNIYVIKYKIYESFSKKKYVLVNHLIEPTLYIGYILGLLYSKRRVPVSKFVLSVFASKKNSLILRSS